ncbi:MAG: SIS domain-containing protein [Tateyamaria sp.]|uniref:SIS domain-containing protein n=1 Tax=Tateyamaria sp. TaxID=1929288 RepID=UPI00329B8418
MDIMNSFEEIKYNLSNALDLLENSDFMSALALVSDAANRNKTIIAFGNGGSASNSSHFASDLIQFAQRAGKQVNCISPIQSSELISAISNDIDFDLVLKSVVDNYLNKDDLLIVFSVSGTSRNIELGVERAFQKGTRVLGLFGKNRSLTTDMADSAIMVQSQTPRIVETVHCFLGQELAARAFEQMP